MSVTIQPSGKSYQGYKHAESSGSSLSKPYELVVYASEMPEPFGGVL